MSDLQLNEAQQTARGAGNRGRASDADPLGIAGSILDGRYLVERLIGSGGFGFVYRAVHLRLDSAVAIKVMRISDKLQPQAREQLIEHFAVEGKLQFTLGALHPSIARVFESSVLIGADGAPRPYLAMEWLQGTTLEREIKARSESGSAPFSLGETIDLLDECVEGLALVHARRIAHRDLKPANIFLAQRNGKITPTLLDFGLAKVVDEHLSASQQFADSDFVETPFTPAYAAPEQWLRRLGATGTWTDVYALALVCSELLAGQRPWSGCDRAQLMGACLDETFRPTPRSLGVEVPDAVEAVFAKALAVSPRDRYLEVRSFWDALRDAASITGARTVEGIRLAASHVALPLAGEARWAISGDATVPPLQAVAPNRQERHPVGSLRRTYVLCAVIGATTLAPTGTAEPMLEEVARMPTLQVTRSTASGSVATAPAKQSDETTASPPSDAARSSTAVGTKAGHSRGRPSAPRKLARRSEQVTVQRADSESAITAREFEPPSDLGVLLNDDLLTIRR